MAHADPRRCPAPQPVTTDLAVPAGMTGGRWEIPRWAEAGGPGSGAVALPAALEGADTLGAFADVMRTLGDETRLRILGALQGRILCVCDIALHVGVSQPLVSHHLKALKAAALVACRKDGPWVYYATRPETFERLGLQALLRPDGVLALAAAGPAGRTPDAP